MRLLLGADTEPASNPIQDFFQCGCGGNPCLPYALAVLYLCLAVVTSTQLLRIHYNVGLQGWSPQKGFQLMHIFICSCRAIFLFSYDHMQKTSANGLRIICVDFPSLLFFTTYTLLLLFWADIVHAATEPKSHCSPLTLFVVVNLAGYVTAALFWSLCAHETTLGTGRRASGVLIALLDILAASVFAIYGNRLLTLLNRSASNYPFLLSKIRQVSWVTIISILSFSWKCLIETISISCETDLAYETDGILNLAFYGVTEIFAMGVVLWLMSSVPQVIQHPGPIASSSSSSSGSPFLDPSEELRTDSTCSFYF